MRQTEKRACKTCGKEFDPMDEGDYFCKPCLRNNFAEYIRILDEMIKERTQTPLDQIIILLAADIATIKNVNRKMRKYLSIPPDNEG